jgi:hypothetical protein
MRQNSAGVCAGRPQKFTLISSGHVRNPTYGTKCVCTVQQWLAQGRSCTVALVLGYIGSPYRYSQSCSTVATDGRSNMGIYCTAEGQEEEHSHICTLFFCLGNRDTPTSLYIPSCDTGALDTRDMQ